MPSKLSSAHATFASLAAEYSSDALLVTDHEDRVLWLNAGFERMTGFTLDDLVGRRPDEVLKGPDTNADEFAKIKEALRLRRPVDIEVIYYRKDGKEFWMESRIVPIFDADGKHTHYMSSSRDISARKELERITENALEREQERQKERKQLSETSEWLYSARSIEELLQVVEQSLKTMIPEAGGQLFLYSNSRNILDLAAQWGETSDTKQLEATDCWALRRGRAYSFGAQDIEFKCDHVEHDHGNAPYFCLPITAHGQTIGLLHLNFWDQPNLKGADASSEYHAFFKRRWDIALLCAEQISLAVANVRLRQELEDQSVRDPLTNLWNRRWLLEAAHKELSRYRSEGVPLSIVSIDVDHFKKFNDHHGHDAGDLVLRAIGSKMREMFTGSLSPCRIGGEEFIVLAANTTLEAAQELTEDFRRAMAHLTVRYAGAALPAITVSAGVTTMTDGQQQVIDLLKIADRALYQAKQMGRNKVCTHDDLDPESLPNPLAQKRTTTRASMSQFSKPLRN
ncbi:sensor domain-containing diguanylate cyclase [Algirhabdus cladophorae]|uniref:sensor domain-containing diguanylate cyclase n=1 Tax=Algirhabdus cladophorae TaxID=3377108 RepID=UPI003B84B188